MCVLAWKVKYVCVELGSYVSVCICAFGTCVCVCVCVATPNIHVSGNLAPTNRYCYYIDCYYYIIVMYYIIIIINYYYFYYI